MTPAPQKPAPVGPPPGPSPGRSLIRHSLFPVGPATASILALVAPLPESSAQSVFAPLTPPPSAQAAATFFSTNGSTAESILSAVTPDPESRNPLRWGPFAAHPRVDYQFINASGILQGTDLVSTIQHIIEPEISLQLGRKWRLDAGLSFGFYTDEALQDTSGYNVSLRGGIPREDWTFGVLAGLGSSESSQVETAQQTQQDGYDLGLTAVYAGQRRMTLDLSINQNISISGSGFNDSYSWSTMNWLNYILTTKTTAGIGLGGGYNQIEVGRRSTSTTGTDSTFEQFQGRLVWKPLEKLSFSLSAGAQFQQFMAESGTEGTVNPIFSLSSGWSPVEGTSFSLGGSRIVGGSIASDEYTVVTRFSFGFSQRLFKQLTLRVSPGYNLTEYQSSTDPNGPATRTDEIPSLHVSLSTILFKKLNVSTFFQFSDNQSDQDLYTYETRQFGLQLGYRF